MDLNGEFVTGAGGHRLVNVRLRRASASNDVCGGGGGDQANFQLQSISVTPDGRVESGTDKRTDKRTDGGFGGKLGIIDRLWMRRRGRRAPRRR